MLISLSDGFHVASFSTLEGDPEWTLFDRRGAVPITVGYWSGAIIEEQANPASGRKRLLPKWPQGAASEPAVPKHIAPDQDVRDDGDERDQSAGSKSPVRKQEQDCGQAQEDGDPGHGDGEKGLETIATSRDGMFDYIGD